MEQQVTQAGKVVSSFVVLLAAFAIAACGQQGDPQESAAAETETTDQANESKAEIMTEITELQITDVVTGEGAAAQAGQDVVVHYTGWLYEPDAAEQKGTKFDSSVDRAQPFSFPLGGKRVIAGWDEGVAGMQVGGKRILIIPPEMGYGANGAGGVIPPNATLVFEVELLEIQ